MAQQYTVHQQTTLLPFLFDTLEGWSKKTIKQRLKNKQILVNNLMQTQHNWVLHPHDIVQIDISQGRTQQPNKSMTLDIVYQDAHIIAIHKPAGLLSVASHQESKVHALALLRTQLSRTHKGMKLWPVHRLDRETSGILLFATSKDIREAMMDNWSKTTKMYLAIVEGVPSVKADTITQPLRMDDKLYQMHVGIHKDAKSAITHYALKEQKNPSTSRSLLEVSIETGRQHQIRAHMAWMGNAIVGDERYGKKGIRMGLHATQITFIHPLSKKSIDIKVDAPRDFYRLLTS
ncbi:MAG: RluA family pseudouridine synthase [Sulfurovum sp.]|nr:RluA family pseudouridine synthase [Sulfurovum sp.]